VINAKKKRGTMEWERFEIFSRKLEIPRENFNQRWTQKSTEMVWTEQKQNTLGRGGQNTQKNYAKKIFMTQVITMVSSLT